MPHEALPGPDARDANLRDVVARAGYLASGPVPVFVSSRRPRRLRRRRAGSKRSATRAVMLLSVIAAISVALAWASVDMARSVFARPDKFAAGPLVFPAPAEAARLPLRDGAVADPAEEHVLAALRQRFALGLAGHGADADRPVGIYGEPGHIDPATGRAAWVMYLGLGSKELIGAPATTIASLMTALLGPDSGAGSWKVPAGARGGDAQCTTTVLAGTSLSVCGWATERTVGVVVSPVTATSWTELAMLMVNMRYDLEGAGDPRS